MLKLLLLCSLYAAGSSSGLEVFETEARTPTVVSTWSFIAAAEKAWKILYEKRGSALDAIEHGCAVCEYKQCDFTVGFGGSPDENGETTLDSMIMDGTTMKVGAVGCLRRIKNAIGVARKVLDTSYHTFLVGDLATKFAVEMGFKEESLATPYSIELHSNWTKNKCQPNFRKNVSPNPTENCGPYHPLLVKSISANLATDLTSHDTIGMIAIDSKSRIAAGTSTNGSKFKIAGRVGDSPVPGSGSYADGNVGAAAATGDGDVMMRFVPTFFAVEEMRKGKSPEEAAQAAIDRIAAKYPKFQGAIIALRKDGSFGAACHGMKSFPYVVANPEIGAPTLLHKECSNFLH